MMSSQPKVSVNLRILPFGHAVIEIKNNREVAEVKIQPPEYTEPKTTDTQTIEITFGGENYVVPKTTGGIL